MFFQKMIQNKIFKKQKGALLIEVILSIFVITTGLLAVMQLITNSLNDSFRNRDIILATGLAQEGVEIVRNLRDNTWLSTTPPNPFRYFSSASKFCRAEFLGFVPFSCVTSFVSTSNIYRLSLSSSGYTYSSVLSYTKFSRMIYVDYQASTEQALVISFVWWGGIDPPTSVATGGKTDCTPANKCVFADMILTKWK